MQDDKAYSGSSQSQLQTGLPRSSSLKTCSGYVGKQKKEDKQATDTGKSSLPGRRKNQSESVNPFLVPEDTMNSLDPKQQRTTSGRKTRALKALNLNMDLDPLPETPSQIGTTYGPPPSPVPWKQSRPILEFAITELFDRSSLITKQFQCWSDSVPFFLAELELVNPKEHGRKPLTTFILRIHEPSSGVVTMVNATLLSMNFEEVSTYLIYSDGLIATRFEWKSKAAQNHSWLLSSGSRPISPPPDGGQSSIKRPWMPLCEE